MSPSNWSRLKLRPTLVAIDDDRWLCATPFKGLYWAQPEDTH